MAEPSNFDRAKALLEALQSRGVERIFFDDEPKPMEEEMPRKKKTELVEQEPTQAVERALEAVPKELTVDAAWPESKSLDELYLKIHKCVECPLGLTRKNLVFGSGNPDADILVIGEAPGASEDETGKPFVGAAGQLLTKILESVGFKREEVYIANIIKCRPPGNRRPQVLEIDTCEPYLQKQIELIKPAFIIALGLTAIDSLLKESHKMGAVRGKFFDYRGIKTMVTYHPAALLRNPEWKRPVWEDMKILRSQYEEYLKTKE
ncbi:MAG: uracil-DNA glycosylase [Chloroflexota bacterium]